MRRRTMQFQGKNVDVLEMDFEVQTEQWNVYKLLDGGVVRMKTTPLRIMRILDETGNPAFTANGEPHLIVNHTTNIVSVEI